MPQGINDKPTTPERPVTPDPKFSSDTLAGWRSSILDAIGVKVVAEPNREEQPAPVVIEPPASEPVVSAEPAPSEVVTTPKPVPSVLPVAVPVQVKQSNPVVRHPVGFSFYLGVTGVALCMAYASFFTFRFDKHFPGVAWWLPWPVAYVEGEIVSWRELEVTASGMRQYYGGVGLSTSEIERRALWTWLEARAIDRGLARSQVGVDSTLVQREYTSLEQSFGTAAALEEFLQRSYRMGISEFKARVLEPLVKRTALEQHLSTDTAALALAAQRAADVRRRVVAGEVSFADAARAVSDDTATAVLGGDLGWFEHNTARPEFVRALAKLEVGEVSEPVQTELGYYLLKLEDVADGEEGPGTENVHVSQILVKPVALERWLNSEIASLTVLRFMPL